MVQYYNKNVVEDIDENILKNPFFETWYDIVKDILLNDEFQRRKLFFHHHNMTVWDHSILVSFKSFLMGRIFHANLRVCAIAGLLHDFYPRVWLYNKDLEDIDDGKYLTRLNEKESLFKMHGFTHAREAAENSMIFFPELMDKRVINSIKRHMFPLNIIPPRYKEGLIITIIDKYDSVHELPSIKVVPSIIKRKFNHKKETITTEVEKNV